MKRLIFAIVMLLIMAKEAFAGCTDKCVIRNPFSGNCAYEMRVCPLSVETFGRWINGATKVDTINALKRLDPKRALNFYSGKLGLDGLSIDDIGLNCLVDTATAGAFGAVCAAGVIEIGAYCFVDAVCASACLASQSAFKQALKDCSF